MPAHHLLAVWNPFYADDALQQHVEVLLRHARAAREHRAGDDAVYVWWGKVKSQRRQQPLPHLSEVLALDEEFEDTTVERVLYLTDYQSLYVAHLLEVVAELPNGEDAHVPAYYRQKQLTCDCWFQLNDIRRIIANDPRGTQTELARLRNVRYHNSPVSVYGGMIDLPLLVTRDDDRQWFSAEERDSLADGLPWVLFDAGRSGVAALQDDLRDNLIGPAVWEQLDPATRTFLATGERLYRENKRDPAFDFSAVLIEYAKALEIEMKRSLRRLLADAKPALRLVNIDGVSRELGRDQVSLGQMARAIASDEGRYFELKRRHPRGEWFVVALPDVLTRLAQARNRGAHAEPLAVSEADALRREVLGIGCLGVVVGLVS